MELNQEEKKELYSRLSEVEKSVERFDTTLKLGFLAGAIIAGLLVTIFAFVFNRVESMFEGYVEIRTNQNTLLLNFSNHDTLENHRNNDQPVALINQEVANLKADFKVLEKKVEENH